MANASHDGQDQRASGREKPRIVRLYIAGDRVLDALTRRLRMVYTGIWLGILRREQLHTLGEWKYGGDEKYWTEEYNNLGLWEWEKSVVDRYFAGCKRVLLVAAGGGREVIALRQGGIEVEAFESDPGLVGFANKLLEKEGMIPDIKSVPWDSAPKVEGVCDGILIGWGAYMHIRGRHRRVKFLQELRSGVVVGSPILVSFTSRNEGSSHYRTIARIGNIVASLLRRERVEVGDSLVPNYGHYFTQAELESELASAGFELVSYDRVQGPHAVGRAV